MPFLTIPAGQSAAQAIKGRGLLTTVSFWTEEFSKGVSAGPLDGRLLNVLELWDDLDGKPGVFVATATVRPGHLIELELIARFSTEVYLDPSRKQWLVWRNPSQEDWKVAVGQTPLLGELARLARAEMDALAYLDPVLRLNGVAWVAVDAQAAPSIAFSLGVHPWQVLHKECRRVACELKYLYYEHELGVPDGRNNPNFEISKSHIEEWWAENMSGFAGLRWNILEAFFTFPSPYPGDHLAGIDQTDSNLSCAASKAISMAGYREFPYLKVPDIFTGEILTDSTVIILPIFGSEERHHVGTLNDGVKIYGCDASAGAARFNVGEVKNFRVFGKSPILVPRLGVVSAAVTDGGSGHALGETAVVQSLTSDATALIRVTAVDLDGVVKGVSIDSEGSYVVPVAEVLVGNATVSLSYGVVSVVVLDGGEGLVSDQVTVVDPATTNPDRAVFSAVVAAHADGGFKVYQVEVVNKGLGYNSLPSLVIEGDGHDASCYTSHGCVNGAGYSSLLLGQRVGLAAKAHIKIAATWNLATTPSGPDTVTAQLATGDPRMKSTPAPPVKVTSPSSFQTLGGYSTLNRYTSGIIGASTPSYDFDCPSVTDGISGSAWKVTTLAVIVNRAGSWRY